MNQTIKQKWVEALRSGEYKQSKGNLRDQSGYCCLGVLCDLYCKETGNGEWIPVIDSGETVSRFDLKFIDDARNPIGFLLAHPIFEWIGVESYKNIEPFPNKSLNSYNDQGTLFSEIADLIEKNL